MVQDCLILNPTEILETLESLIDKKVLTSNKEVVSFPSSLFYLKKDQKFSSILEVLVKAELFYPGGAKSVVTQLKQLVKKREHVITSSPRKTDIRSVVSERDVLAKEILSSAVSLAGRDGKVYVEKSTNDSYSIELRESSSFPCQSMLKEFRLSDARIIIADGFIESVSEIHRLLSSAAETKENYVFVARGFSNDVLNTISVNNRRLTLSVWPVESRLNFDSVNLMKDLSIASGARIASSDSGDLISSMDVTWSGKVRSASWINGNLEVYPLDREYEIKSHVSFLRNKSDQCDDVNLKQVINTRVQNFCSKKVIIRIPDSMSGDETRRNIESALKTISATIKHGKLSIDDLGSIMFPYVETIRQILDSHVV